MIIPKGKTIYIGGRKFGPGSDCPDNLLDDKQKEKLKKHADMIARKKATEKKEAEKSGQTEETQENKK